MPRTIIHLTLVAAMSAVAWPTQAADIMLQDHDQHGITVTVVPDSLGSGECEFSVHLADTEPRGRLVLAHDGTPFTVHVPADLVDVDPLDCYLQWRLELDDGAHRRNLAHLSPGLEAMVYSHHRPAAGDTTLVVCDLRERLDDEPVSGAQVLLELTQADTLLSRAAATTDEDGTARLRLAIPLSARDGALLRMDARHGQRALQTRQSVTIEAAYVTLLTTDRPLYRPGDTVEVRALTRRGLNHQPAVGDTCTLTLEGPDRQGRNHVLAEETRVTDEWGLTTASFTLGDPIREGSYSIGHHLPGMPIIRQRIRVERYTLPRWQLSLQEPDHALAPGDTLRGSVSALDLLGTPVQGASVRLDIRGRINETNRWVLDGILDDDGCWEFAQEVPDDLRLSGDNGNAQLMLTATVTDRNGHTQSTITRVPITLQPLLVQASTEDGALEPGLPNTVHFQLGERNGQPLEGTIRWLNGPATSPTLATDEHGLATLRLEPHEMPADGRFELLLRDHQGRHRRTDIMVQVADEPGCRIKAANVVDENLHVSVTTAEAGTSVRVFLSQDGMVLDSIRLTSSSHHGADPVTHWSGMLRVPTPISGGVTLEAWWTLLDGRRVARQRQVLCRRNDGLQLNIATARATHAPGDTATFEIKVRDAQGNGVCAVIGGSMVDEALLQLDAGPDGQRGTEVFEQATLQHAFGRGPLTNILRRAVTGGRLTRHEKWLLGQRLNPGPRHLSFHPTSARTEGSLPPYSNRHWRLLWSDFQHLDAAVDRLAERWYDQGTGERFPRHPALSMLLFDGVLKRHQTRDPWGTPYRLVVKRRDDGYHVIDRFLSAGIDGRWNTPDDLSLTGAGTLSHVITTSPDLAATLEGATRVGRRWYWLATVKYDPRWDDVMGVLPAFDVDAARYMVEVKNVTTSRELETFRDQSLALSAPPMPGTPRIRRDFRETAWWQPRLITDGLGRARVRVPLPDSRTRWQLTAVASDHQGCLGEHRGAVDTDLDFYLNLAAMRAATTGDVVHVPAMVFNGVSSAQRVAVERSVGAGATLLASPDTLLALAAGARAAVPCPVRFEAPGQVTLLASARGPAGADAMERTLRVKPAGRPWLGLQGGFLDRSCQLTPARPDGCRPASTRLLVHPSLASQAAMSLLGLLEAPGGCFEQLTSALRIHAIINHLDPRHRRLAPSTRKTVDRAFHDNLQSFTYYEADGGGFSWFGRGPADPRLTATALLMFIEMDDWGSIFQRQHAEAVHALLSAQSADGSWSPPGEIATDDEILATTALACQALAVHGRHKAQNTEQRTPNRTRLTRSADRALAYLESKLDAGSDTEALARAALASITLEPASERARRLGRELARRAESVPRGARWHTKAGTVYLGRGLAGDVETTALAMQTLTASGGHDTLVNQALSWLIDQRRPGAGWGSTQATLQALKALVCLQDDPLAEVTGTLTVRTRDSVIWSGPLDSALNLNLGPDPGPISLQWDGTGRPLWSLESSGYLPWNHRLSLVNSPGLALSTSLSPERATPGDVVDLSLAVTWAGATPLPMPMLTVDLPPGVVLLGDAMDSQVDRGVISRWEQRGEQLVIYLARLQAGEERTVSMPFLASWAGRIQAGAARVWTYYDPDTEAWAPPRQLVIQPGA